MNLRRIFVGRLLMIAYCVTPGLLLAQEGVRDLNGPGQQTKFLTHNQMDRWLFEGKQGETLIVQTHSREFDPILRLAMDDKGAKPLVEVDDDGSQSSFAIRLPADGKYEIQIHAFKFQGGGNYTLEVQRFQAQPIEVGKSAVGVLDSQGKSHLFFNAAKDQILAPELRGGASWELLDVKGKPLSGWAGTARVETAGECYLVLQGSPGYRYEATLRQAEIKMLVDNKDWSEKLNAGELHVWNIDAQPGEFRVIEVVRAGDLISQLSDAPLDKQDEQQLSSTDRAPALRTYPIASRGRRIRYAAVFGREGRYQLSLLARGDASYQLLSSDPSVAIKPADKLGGKLSVGAAGFYELTAEPGELLEVNLGAEQFVPLLRLYDPRGARVASSQIGSDELQAHVQHMAVVGGKYRLQASSLGDGGGGDYQLALNQVQLKAITIGGRADGELTSGATDFWSFAAKEGDIIFLSVRSETFQPVVSLRSPTGVILATQANSNPATGSLLAVKIPQGGRHTIWISSQRGAGKYAVRLIDGK